MSSSIYIAAFFVEHVLRQLRVDSTLETIKKGDFKILSHLLKETKVVLKTLFLKQVKSVHDRAIFFMLQHKLSGSKTTFTRCRSIFML